VNPQVSLFIKDMILKISSGNHYDDCPSSGGRDAAINILDISFLFY
jgi:hypothetical protein